MLDTVADEATMAVGFGQDCAMPPKMIFGTNAAVSLETKFPKSFVGSDGSKFVPSENPTI